MKELYKALAAFQQEVPVIYKGTKGYSYTYADLTAIFKTINPIMAKHGLGFTQMINGTDMVTRVFHSESGEHIESTSAIPQDVKLKGMNDYQIQGSAITYFRRYSLSSMLGLVTDADMDACGEQVPAKPKEKKPIPLEGELYEKTAKYYKDNGHFEAVEKVYIISDEVKDKIKQENK